MQPQESMQGDTLEIDWKDVWTWVREDNKHRKWTTEHMTNKEFTGAWTQEHRYATFTYSIKDRKYGHVNAAANLMMTRWKTEMAAFMYFGKYHMT